MSDYKLTANALSVLLRVYISGDFRTPVLGDRELDRQYLDELEACGLVRKSGQSGIQGAPAPVDYWEATPLGLAWVKDILRTPVPRTAFIGADGKEIV